MNRPKSKIHDEDLHWFWNVFFSSALQFFHHPENNLSWHSNISGPSPLKTSQYYSNNPAYLRQLTLLQPQATHAKEQVLFTGSWIQLCHCAQEPLSLLRTPVSCPGQHTRHLGLAPPYHHWSYKFSWDIIVEVRLVYVNNIAALWFYILEIYLHLFLRSWTG